MPGVLPAITPFITGEVPAAGPPAVTMHGAVEKLQPGRYMLRHIAPKAASETGSGVFNPLGAGFVVLNQTFYADPLPQQRIPSSPDMHEGRYTLRMFDSGEFSLSFPNKDASDGQPWRNRFDTRGHREFIEIAREGEVEAVGLIVKRTADRQKVTIEGFDGLFLLKKAFEQDWVGVMGPRDMIEKYSGVWAFTVSDSFPASESLPTPYFESYTNTTVGGHASVAIDPAGHGLSLHIDAVGVSDTATAQAASVGSLAIGPSGCWTLTMVCNITEVGVVNAEGFLELVNPSTGIPGVQLQVKQVVGGFTGAIGSNYESVFYNTTFLSNPWTVGPHTLTLRCDGRSVLGFVDGQLVGGVVSPVTAGVTGLQIRCGLISSGTGSACTMQISRITLNQLQPLLMRGSEKGDYVLPGTAATYPTGGLHARYYPTWKPGVDPAYAFVPDPRRQGFPNFVETQVTRILDPEPPSGIPGENFTARFFGAVYLDLENNGEIAFKLSNLDDGARLYVGRTQAGQQIIEAWEEGAPREATGNIKASVVGARKGWFPIILEYFNAGGGKGIQLGFNPPTAGWTDPGGTVIAAGVFTICPSTSLSPLGCVDARIQGSSHFDIVIEQAKNFGYQVRCEPRQLESGEFPGRIVPKARLGKDTDEIIEAGDIDRRSEVNNYTATLDATDNATSLRAFGSGIADGKGSQVAFEAISVVDERDAMFDIQAWLSAGDIAFPQLLVARANAELGLRTQPWENVEGEPIARDRLSDTFPLTGALSQFRWQPGDGVRLRLPDVQVEDTAPRQILQVTRNFTPEGRTSTSVGFRSRPKDPLYAVRGALREATRPARAFQKQYATRVTPFINEGEQAAGAFTLYQILPLFAGDRLVSAIVYLSLVTAGKKIGLEINGNLRTSVLGGPWTNPVAINILPYAQPVSGTDQRLYFRFKNEDAAPALAQGQLVVTLLV